MKSRHSQVSKPPYSRGHQLLHINLMNIKARDNSERTAGSCCTIPNPRCEVYLL